MKTFDEWFEENYGCLDMLGTRESEKNEAKKIWQAAQEVQRESDADLVEKEFSFVEEYDPSDGFILAEQIRNNKAS